MDAWVEDYNRERPHQALDERLPVVPADRFEPAPPGELELWVPPSLEVIETPPVTLAEPKPSLRPEVVVARGPRPDGGAIQLDKPAPASGNIALCGHQFWLGPARSGQVIRFWIDREWVHLSTDGHRFKSLRSRFTAAELDKLVAQGAVPAGPAPEASKRQPRRGIVEVERTVSMGGTVSLGSRVILAAWMLAGRRVGIWIEDDAPLLFFDPETRELLRTRPNPLKSGEARTLQRRKPVGQRPRPSTEPITVERRTDNTGGISVAKQRVALGRQFRHSVVTVHVSQTTLAIELPDGDTKVVRRNTDQPVRNIRTMRPRTAATSIS